jgi:hypothetical protein
LKEFRVTVMLEYHLKKSSRSNNKDGKTPGSNLGTKAQASKPPQKPNKPTSFWQRLIQPWDNLNFRTKLLILLLTSSALPVIAVTQALENVTENRFQAKYEENLKQELQVLDDAIENAQETNKVVAATIAKLVRDSGIDLSNSKEVAAQRKALATFAEDPSNDLIGQSFHIITDAQGRTVTQYIEILKDQDFSSYPALPPKDGALIEPSYQLVSLPTGIPLGNVPIVKNALSSGQPLAGLELLNAKSLQRLGLDKQADIGIRKQKIEGLPKPKQPFPEGTYDVNRGEAGLVLMAVHPIEVNGKRVGTAMVGTLKN